MEGRDKLGRFAKGWRSSYHKPHIGNLAGKHRTPKRQVLDALDVVAEAMPQILKAMIRTAIGKDDSPVAVQQAAREYLCDRIYGRPNQPMSGQRDDALRALLEEYRLIAKGEPPQG